MWWRCGSWSSQSCNEIAEPRLLNTVSTVTIQHQITYTDNRKCKLRRKTMGKLWSIWKYYPRICLNRLRDGKISFCYLLNKSQMQYHQANLPGNAPTTH
jgi:hypothetical protein